MNNNTRFKQIDIRLNYLLQISRNKKLNTKEALEFKELKAEWNTIINQQDLNKSDVFNKPMPYAI